jgi:hypothetical protein
VFTTVLIDMTANASGSFTALSVPPVFVFLLLSFAWCKLTSAGCPHQCSGNGLCLADRNCHCNNGFYGADCSLRSCPKDMPWFHVAESTDIARLTPVVCSAMGECNPTSGVCKCYAGFQGRACERMKCANDCSGNGRCISMREAAITQDDINLLSSTTYTEWDADRVFGCVCDSGYTGYDCSENTCARGADPLWPTGAVNEVQAFDCTATGGSFRFRFRNEVTDAISQGATVSQLESILGKLQAINVTTVSVTGSAGPICDSDGVKFKITFIANPGDLPTLAVVNNELTGTSASCVYDSGNSITGTKTDEVCNNRGTCGQNTGICACYAGFKSSNARAATGEYGDCGYNSISLTACPGSTPCNGHGICSGSPNFRCTCFDGWMNGECSQYKCAYGRAWFDEPSATNTAHAMAECSNRGLCDRQKGSCSCQPGFTGKACERLECPLGGDDKIICSGFGRCVSMAEAGKRRLVEGAPAPIVYGSIPGSSSTWDFDKIYGCVCDDYSTVGGVKALGFDCSQAGCPVGDDPKTHKTAANEVQVVKCVATGGTFQLSFRGETTSAIPYNAIDEGSLLKLDGQAGITQGSVTVTTSVDLSSVLSANDVIEIETYQVYRNYTVQSVSSNSIVVTEPIGLRAGQSFVKKRVLSVKSALEKLNSIKIVDISFNPLQSGNVPSACSSTGVFMSITFRSMPGDLPSISAVTSSLTGSPSVTIFELLKGTRENELCSNNGLCDHEKGLCNCFDGTTSSNGEGNTGNLGECGFMNIKAKGDFS